VLYWQGVSADLLHTEKVGPDERRIFFEVECDEWRLRRLVVHCEKIIGVRSVVSSRPEGIDLPVVNPRLSSEVG
jgi:hypothetical protein